MVFGFIRNRKPASQPTYGRLDVRGPVFPTSEGYSAIEIYVDQLVELGQAETCDGDVLVPWTSVFELLESEEHVDSFSLLGLPNRLECAPILVSTGTLTDERFEIAIQGWKAIGGGDISDAKYDGGGCIRVGESTYLLPKPTWELCNALNRRPQESTGPAEKADNFVYWGLIRKLAIEAGAAMDDFLFRTVVLTPQHLKLDVRQLDLGGTKVVEIAPTFEDAPAEWLSIFDRRDSVPDFYNISVPGQGQLHVARTAA